MAAIKYYPEDELVEEFTAFCKERNLTINEESAEQFVEWKGDQLENAQED